MISSLMIQGAGSNVEKSMLVAGLARACNVDPLVDMNPVLLKP
jgi:cobyric acid synthase